MITKRKRCRLDLRDEHEGFGIRCGVTGRRTYLDRYQAKRAAKRFRSRFRHRSKAYRCLHCAFWHLMVVQGVCV